MTTITRKMVVDCILHRIPGYLLCGLCQIPLRPGDDIEWDHIHATTFAGPHHYTNLRPVHDHCHKAKTKLDVQANAKVKRLSNPKPSKRPMKPSGRKIPSRPFSASQRRPKQRRPA